MTMIRTSTPVETEKLPSQLGYKDCFTLLGSCFSDEIAGIMDSLFFNMMSNPTGTLYNPASIAAVIRRMDSREHFTMDDVEEIGNGIAGAVFLYIRRAAFAKQNPAEKLGFGQVCRPAGGVFENIGEQIGIIFLHDARAFQGTDVLHRTVQDFKQGQVCPLVLKNSAELGRYRPARTGERFSVRRVDGHGNARAVAYVLHDFPKFGYHGSSLLRAAARGVFCSIIAQKGANINNFFTDGGSCANFPFFYTF